MNGYWKDVDRNTAFDTLAKGGKAKLSHWDNLKIAGNGQGYIMNFTGNSTLSSAAGHYPPKVSDFAPDSKWQIWVEPPSEKLLLVKAMQHLEHVLAKHPNNLSLTSIDFHGIRDFVNEVTEIWNEEES